MTAPLEHTWQQVWRKGFAPQFNDKALLALRGALERDDKTLLQCATTSPPPMPCVSDWPVEGACGIGWAAWQANDLVTVGEVVRAFAEACCMADVRIGESAVCRYFLNWFDSTPRDVMRPLLIKEINLELDKRKGT